MPLSFTEQIPVTICWWISPNEFYVQPKLKESEFKLMMSHIQAFYRNRPAAPSTPKHTTGSYVIVRNINDEIFYRAQVLDYRDAMKKYKIQFIDIGNKAAVTDADIWLIEKRFTQLERLAIRCSLSKVILNYDRKEIENKIDKYIPANESAVCQFLVEQNDTVYANVEYSGTSLRDSLIQNDIVTPLPEGNFFLNFFF